MTLHRNTIFGQCMNGIDSAIGTEGTRYQSLLSLLEGPLWGIAFIPVPLGSQGGVLIPTGKYGPLSVPRATNRNWLRRRPTQPMGRVVSQQPDSRDFGLRWFFAHEAMGRQRNGQFATRCISKQTGADIGTLPHLCVLPLTFLVLGIINI